ncbi:hypothetical protein EWB00_003750, partial [Schistosoma japonicum]
MFNFYVSLYNSLLLLLFKRIPVIFILCILLKCINHVISSKPLDIEYDTPLTISFNPNSDQVILNEPLIIRCELHALRNDYVIMNKNLLFTGTYSMFFQCPLAPWGKFCFHNCQSACVGELSNQCPYDNELSLIKCRTSTNENGYHFYEYTIPNLTKIWLQLNTTNKYYDNDKSNGFSCKTGGLQTPKITLKLMKSIMTTTIQPIHLLYTLNTINSNLINHHNLSIDHKIQSINSIYQLNQSINNSEFK